MENNYQATEEDKIFIDGYVMPIYHEVSKYL